MTNPWFRNIEFIKANADAHFQVLGYELLGYEGADPSLIYGGFAWFQVFRKDRPELIYTIQVRRQGDDLKWLYERIINPEAGRFISTNS